MNRIISKSALKTGTGLLILFLICLRTSAQRAHTYTYDCVTAGQNMVIDAVITNADPITFYHWQYKTSGSGWTCFVNGANNINGTNFTVSGTTGTGENNAPALTIYGATVALEDVIVRVAMAKIGDPCSSPVPSQIWNADDEQMEETKYLRLHVSSNTLSCPPNAYSCPGNLLVNTGKYYGGFENTSFEVSSETYIRNNISSGAGQSDLAFGTGEGHYQDINNPYAMNSSFVRNLAPHSGNFQMVVEGSSDNSKRAWHKTLNVVNGRQYSFTLWVARVDTTAPVIELRANNTLLILADLSSLPVGEWKLVQGSFAAFNTMPINFNIRDGKPGGKNNFVLDDICLRECNSCSILELHQLYLTASLSRDEVKMKWIAENEMGTAGFIIEKSQDGINYDPIGTKASTGPVNTPTAYYFADNVQNAGANSTLYYRIKAIDGDGRYAYSNVVIIRLGRTTSVQTWPVPFTDYINVSYTAEVNSKVEVTLIDSRGEIIRKSGFAIMRGLNQLALNDLNTVSPSLYFVRIMDQTTNEVYIRKIIK